MRIGIDAGGTFTDFVIQHDDGRLASFKLPSNPRNPAAVILAGLPPQRKLEIIHGSTVATNALLERKGAHTAFVTTAGFEDLLLIGRQNRPELYNLSPAPRRLLIDPADCHGVAERTHADGSIARSPTPAELARLRRRLRQSGVRSVAICLLHGWQTPANEQLLAAALGDEFFLSVSHQIAPEFREYERAATTAVNAYVGPLMDSYLGALGRPVHIMQSSGGLLSAEQARREPVRTILSGPAGGIIGAVGAAKASGLSHILAFDMGGTSTDVSLSEGAPRMTVEAMVDGLPLRVPMLDIHTVGAGGGSLARIDEGGLLRVGPESAGADPGPACYGAGERPTVTDAQVVLGRIAATQLAGGSRPIFPERAAAAVASLGLGLEAGAAGILRVANASMERAIRAVSVERGYDPRQFTLLAFGGGGGLHACEIAAALSIRQVLVPQFAGALSALGMLLADHVRDFAIGVLGQSRHADAFAALAARAPRGGRRERFADVRYAGQSYELTIPWSKNLAADFAAAHEKMYGYSIPGRPVEVVTLRLRVTHPVRPPALRHPGRSAAAPEMRRVWVDGRFRSLPAYTRPEVPATPIAGPALVLDYGSTTLIPPHWHFHCDEAGALVIAADR
ncbi:MAG: hydantoinase/oxoprolinase family protein [Acidobacteriaceae bacterium]|nr:hydantoinase/oxoprolinase family protein [Acidobacteriaceae bacterium]